jgi:hypothetical protein
VKGFGDELGAVKGVLAQPTLDTDIVVLERGVEQGSQHSHDEGLAAAPAARGKSRH